MRRRYLIILCALSLLAACNRTPEQEKKTLVDAGEVKYTLNMHFAKQAWSKDADTLFLRFRITDNFSKKKVFWADLKKEDFEIREDGGNPPDKEVFIEKITQKSGGQSERIDQNVAFWFMVDRGKTISDKDMESMKSSIRKTIENLPDSCAFISFFDKDIGEKKLITKGNFREFEREFAVKQETRDLYQSIISNFEKFAKDTLLFGKKAADIAKYLLIFTDGRINLTSVEEIEKLDNSDAYIRQIDNTWKNQVQIHAFRYGSSSTLVDKVLNDICLQRQNPGGFYPADNVAGIVDSLRGFVDNLSADYELMLVNHAGKIYYGAKQTLQVIVNKDNRNAVGKIQYAVGSKEDTVVAGGKAENIYIAVIIGIVILFLAFLVMQILIPYIISLISNFEKKYVVSYQPISTEEGEVYEACSYCQEPLEKGELIVVKCPHKIHWDCWKENGCKCVEYGQNCKDGIQFHFDKSHAFDLKRSPYYLKWAMSGMISGFFTWIIFKFSLKITVFFAFIDKLLNIFYPEKLKELIEGQMLLSSSVESSFQRKINGLLLVGILLGFVLTFLFSYINDFRVKKGQVLLSIFLRALLGALIGFLAFLIGSIVCILLGQYGNVWWLDALPWLLFGGSIALCLAFKTTIKWQDALIGGLISGILSFFILYTTSYLPSFGVMFGFMLCSTGLGISIVAKHHLAQKYFLKYKGEKRESEIAIHKWMNESGGSNEVTIGKSNHCTIQMNWDNSEEIAEKQVKLYIDPKRRVPMMKIVENGVTYDGRDARKDDQLPLKNGVKFTIGNTVFQYVEK